MEQLLRNLGTLDAALRDRLTNTAIVVVVLLLVRWGVVRLALARVSEPEHRYRWRKTATYATAVLLVLLVGRVWSSALSQLGTFLGLMTAALAIALREPVTNLAGWVFILWRKPFKIGDRVQIAGYAGDVVDIRLFQFSVMEIGYWVKADGSTGRIVHIPNGKVFTEPQANYNSAFPFIWNELPVLITFESNWREAKAILQRVALAHGMPGVTASSLLASAQYSISRLAGDPTVITSVEDSGVLLTIRYLCQPRERRKTAEVIWEAVLTEFGQRADIDFAYPTTRFYHNTAEGKPGARAPLPEA